MEEEGKSEKEVGGWMGPQAEESRWTPEAAGKGEETDSPQSLQKKNAGLPTPWL